MSRTQSLDRAELCFSMSRARGAVTMKTAPMLRASWLWLFVWAGMFEGCV